VQQSLFLDKPAMLINSFVHDAIWNITWLGILARVPDICNSGTGFSDVNINNISATGSIYILCHIR
jgi:hypothetical protein